MTSTVSTTSRGVAKTPAAATSRGAAKPAPGAAVSSSSVAPQIKKGLCCAKISISCDVLFF